jgi:DNA replication initiation complex subunit (GINS family)
MDVKELTVDFSNTLSKRQIEEMATVDEFEVVKEVQVSLFQR